MDCTATTTVEIEEEGELCPICKGLGFVRQDLPPDHPDFGKLIPCECRQAELANRKARKLRSRSNLEGLQDKTLEGFSSEGRGNLTPDKAQSLAQALQAAREFAEDSDGWLVLSGPYGCGKTHLAVAIANAQIAAGALFVNVPDLLDHLRASYSPGASEGYDERFATVRDAPLLTLDDLGTENATTWAVEKLYQILNHRYNLRLPTIITTNNNLDNLDPRIGSRMRDQDLSRVIAIDAPDYRAGDTGSNGHNPALPTKTFEGFRARSDNARRALKLARAYAANPEGWLALLGPHGAGKTHLAASIAHQVEGGVAFYFVADLLDEIRGTYDHGNGAYGKLMASLREAGVLILDDYANGHTPWANEKLHQVLNYRYNLGLSTVFTSTLELGQIDPWLRQRLIDRDQSRVFALVGPRI
jgi:DNA replication protein DnaC